MLRITVPGRNDVFDASTSTFYSFPDTVIELEHSLEAVSKWEAKFKKSFFRREKKTSAEALYYVKCMTLNEVPWFVYGYLTDENQERIKNYIEDPHTATVIKHKNGKGGNGSAKFMTSELIYYYMTELNIPFTCEKWHINRLLMLIEVCCEEKKPKKKMSSRDVAGQYRAMNAARRKAH